MLLTQLKFGGSKMGMPKKDINNGLEILSILIFSIALTTACSRTFKKSSIELNPIFFIANPNIIKESSTLKIGLGDYELPGIKLVNHAKFIVVSRDRLKFKVDLVHKWRSYVKPCKWKSQVEIDSQKYHLECDRRHIGQITWMWEEQRRKVLKRNRFGDPTEISAYEKHRMPLKSMVVFVGKATLSVYNKDIISKNTKTIKLTLEKDGTKFVFIWELKKPQEGKSQLNP